MDPFHRNEARVEVAVEPPTAIDQRVDDIMQTGRFGDGRLVKMEVDYSAQVDSQLIVADNLAKEGKTAEAIESLEKLEKDSRINCDMRSNQRLLCHMVKLAFDANNWQFLCETVKTLCKKRLLIKSSIKKMVQECCEIVPKAPDAASKSTLIDTLRAVTAGKIYLEVERARLTKQVAEKLETEGKVDEAREMMMELQVETYGTMEVEEKVNYLLHQMRLSIASNHFTRASIISRKISTKFFEREGTQVQLMKLEFYKYMVQIGLSENNYLDVCKHFLAILNTPQIQENNVKKIEILKCVVFYLLLSAHDNEKWELLHRVNAMRELEQIPKHKELLELFIHQELIFWSKTIESEFAPILFAAQPPVEVISDSVLPSTHVFPMNKEDGQKRRERLHDCVGEHNVRMVAKYYSRITFQRMAKLLEFGIEQMEAFVCKMIVDGVIPEVKIHRPSQIIYLSPKKNGAEVLDEWVFNVRKLTDTMNKVSQLIAKEEMVHGLQISQRI
ncbi:hypothetical protein niasHS_000565 [Heterodera schachtii]|uniref:PCI domain-containing protein n=1 Tax=Heterodera schachtii TaxID=97005 RepID=A0ABD2K4L3_HETSC